MKFILVQIIQALILPPASLLLLMLAGMLLLRKRPVAGRWMLSLSIALLYLLSLPITADVLVKPLESFAPPLNEMPAKADAVVVLGSGVLDLSWVPAPAAPSETATSRLITGVEIAKRLRVPLVLSGGSDKLDGMVVGEGISMAFLAQRLGMPRDQIKISNISRKTYEEAASVRLIVQGNDIILVTSAFHMKRSTAFFRKRGFTVIPAPVAYRGQSRFVSLNSILPRAGHLETSSFALSEYISTVWYRMRGLI
jgi:uncharacterized SAM-binding protein YcdF (DUF218 family)